MRKYMVLVLLSVWTIPQMDFMTYLDMFPNIRELARVESSFKPYAKNPKDTDGRPKYGLLQFGKWEFYTWANSAGLENASIWNPIHQIIVARWAEDNGMLNRWGPYKSLVRSGKIILQ